MSPLYEYEAKQLFRQYGVPVPRGALWPAGADAMVFPAMVKAQLLEGGRGKRGGIRPARDARECREAAEDLLRCGLTSAAGHVPVPHVYVEEKIDIEKELYLAIAVDRDAKSAVILASAEGGVDIETHSETVVRLPVDRSAGLQSYMMRRVCRQLGLAGPLQAKLGGLLASMWRFFVAEEALLVEINPVAVTRDQGLVALDAKVGLDENAAFRHSWSKDRPETGTDFERACSRLGVSGVEVGDGPVAAVMSGAGLMMATLDILKAMKGRVGWLIDLGGVVFQDATKLTEVVRVVRARNPKVILFNYYLQVARCDTLASAIAAGFHDGPGDARVIVRMKGYGADEGKEILALPGFYVTESLEDACRRVIEAAGVEGVGPCGNPD